MRTRASASASDDQGELGRVYVDEWEGNGSERRYHQESRSITFTDYYYSNWRSDSSHSSSEGWSRRAGIATTAGAAGVSRECSDAESGQHSFEYTRYENPEFSSSGNDHSHSFDRETRCRDMVDVSHADRETSAGLQEQGCTDHWESSGNYHSSNYRPTNSSYSYAVESTSSTYDCRNGVIVEQFGESYFAGSHSRCDQSNDTWDYSSNEGENTTDFSASTARSNCFNGVALDGPDGAHFDAGTKSSSSETCTTDGNATYCDSWDDNVSGAGLTWEHNPVGPTDLDFYFLRVS
jgi:hypothetical protein